MRRIVRESLGLLFLIGLLSVSVSQRSSGDEPVPPDPVLEEIIQLRRALGDTRQPGQNRTDGAADDETFVRALRRVAAQDRSEAETGLPPAAPQPTAHPELALPPVIAPPAATTPQPPPFPAAPRPQPLDDYDLYDPAAEQHAELVNSLRATSRMLDAVAHDHEDKSQYDEADRLHNLARKLRNEARRLDRSSETRPAATPAVHAARRVSVPAPASPPPVPPAPAY